MTYLLVEPVTHALLGKAGQAGNVRTDRLSAQLQGLFGLCPLCAKSGHSLSVHNVSGFGRVSSIEMEPRQFLAVLRANLPSGI